MDYLTKRDCNISAIVLYLACNISSLYPFAGIFPVKTEKRLGQNQLSGEFNARGCRNSTNTAYKGIYAKGNITFKSTEVNFYSPAGTTLYAEDGAITFENSIVALGNDYKNLFNKAPNLVFTNDATTIDARAASSPGASNNDATGKITLTPYGDTATYNAADYATYRYFKVAPSGKGGGTIKLPNGTNQTNYGMVLGTDDQYFDVVDGIPVQITEQTNFKNYKLKISYPVNGMLTVTLNGAQLTKQGMYGIGIVTAATCPVKVVTEADSTVIASYGTSGAQGRAFDLSGAGTDSAEDRHILTLCTTGP